MVGDGGGIGGAVVGGSRCAPELGRDGGLGTACLYGCVSDSTAMREGQSRLWYGAAGSMQRAEWTGRSSPMTGPEGHRGGKGGPRTCAGALWAVKVVAVVEALELHHASARLATRSSACAVTDFRATSAPAASCRGSGGGVHGRSGCMTSEPSGSGAELRTRVLMATASILAWLGGQPPGGLGQPGQARRCWRLGGAELGKWLRPELPHVWRPRIGPSSHFPATPLQDSSLPLPPRLALMPEGNFSSEEAFNSCTNGARWRSAAERRTWDAFSACSSRRVTQHHGRTFLARASTPRPCS